MSFCSWSDMDTFRYNPNRRHFLRSMTAGAVLMPALVSEMLGAERGDLLAPRRPHFSPRAKQVIFINLSGGVSHIDTFDPKPELIKNQG